MKIAEIRIEIHLTENGDEVAQLTVDGNLPAVSALGHLRMAEDTILSGEWEDEGEES